MTIYEYFYNKIKIFRRVSLNELISIRIGLTGDKLLSWFPIQHSKTFSIRSLKRWNYHTIEEYKYQRRSDELNICILLSLWTHCYQWVWSLVKHITKIRIFYLMHGNAPWLFNRLVWKLNPSRTVRYSFLIIFFNITKITIEIGVILI